MSRVRVSVMARMFRREIVGQMRRNHFARGHKSGLPRLKTPMASGEQSR